MQELSMHILDIVQNSLAAGATLVEIRIRESLAEDILMIEVQDNGRGIPQEVLNRVMDPFFTSRITRETGLGLSLLKEATELSGGCLKVQSEEGRGTRVMACFQLDHFDRAPLGDMGETVGVIISGNPAVDFFYEHQVDGQIYVLDTREMRNILGPIKLEDPLVLDFVRQDIQTGLKKIGAATFPKVMEVLR
ncbi:MAG: ATP-binding protein [Deltaproteobacteria bacterium]|nr:ATP-binding protein [Deltaproteobacteria bacterium]